MSQSFSVCLRSRPHCENARHLLAPLDVQADEAHPWLWMPSEKTKRRAFIITLMDFASWYPMLRTDVTCVIIRPSGLRGVLAMKMPGFTAKAVTKMAATPPHFQNSGLSHDSGGIYLQPQSKRSYTQNEPMSTCREHFSYSYYSYFGVIRRLLGQITQEDVYFIWESLY